jgi:probable rRNA maturation factor
MRSFNSQFFGRSDTTDVLSVTIDEEFSDGYLWGEIYISTETAERESEKRAVSWEEEALLYIIHGLLHLAGFEDTSEKDRRNMWDIQMDILEQCGLFRESFVEDQ